MHKHKKCKTHGILDEKDIAIYSSKNISKKTGKPLLVKLCRLCNIIKTMNFKAKNPNAVYIYNKKTELKNREKRIQKALQWNKSPNGIDYQKQYSKKTKETLHDSYIKRLLLSQLKIKKSKIPQELIQTKRALIQLKQLIKDRTK
jgi:hypothetical protein